MLFSDIEVMALCIFYVASYFLRYVGFNKTLCESGKGYSLPSILGNASFKRLVMSETLEEGSRVLYLYFSDGTVYFHLKGRRILNVICQELLHRVPTESSHECSYS